MEAKQVDQFRKTGLKRYRYGGLAFLIALLPRLLFLKYAYPLNITGDEFYMFLIPAKLAGMDWSGVVGQPLYYGYGFLVLLTPLFKWIHDPVVLYRVMVVIMILAQSAIAPISYHLLKRFLKVEQESICCLGAVACSYLVMIRAVYVYNESIYILVVWVIAWLLLLLQETKGKRGRLICSLLLMLALCYAMSLHSRAVTLWMALAVLIVFYAWTYRKCIVSLPVVFLAGGAGFLLSQKGLSYIVDNFLTVSSNSGVGNTVVSLSVASIFSSLKSGIAWIYIVAGQVNTMTVITGGFAILCTVIGCVYVWKALLRKKELTEAVSSMEARYMLLSVFFFAAVAITIFGQAFSWLGGVTRVIETGVAGDGLRAITYTRYYGAYFGPILMLGIAFAVHKKSETVKLFKSVLIIVLTLQAFWVIFILPYIAGFSGSCWDYAPFSFTKGWVDPIRLRTYLPASVMVLAITALFYVCYRTGKGTAAVGILCVLLMYQYCYNAVNSEGYRGEANYRCVDDSYELLKEVEAKTGLPETIYVQDWAVKETTLHTATMLQYMFLDQKVKIGYPAKDDEEGIYLSNYFVEDTELLEQGYLCAQLDDQEYIYVKGERLQSAFKGKGINLLPYMINTSKINLREFASDTNLYQDQLSYMESSGEEGNFIYGYQMPFTAGEFSIKMNMEVLEAADEQIGSFAVYEGGICIYEKGISQEMVSEDGKLQFEMSSMCNTTDSLEIRVWLNAGSRVRMYSCEFGKVSNRYEAGSEAPDDMQTVVRYIQQLDTTASVYYLQPNTNSKVELSELKKRLKSQRVQEVQGDETGFADVAAGSLIIMPNNHKKIFETVHYSTILQRFDLYTVLRKEEPGQGQMQAETKLSGAYGVEKKYFGESAIALPAGTYEITVVIEAADLSCNPEELELQIAEFGEVLHSKNNVLLENGHVYLKGTISSEIGFWGLTVDVLGTLQDEINQYFTYFDRIVVDSEKKE